MTRTDFRNKAHRLPASLLGVPVELDPTQHKTGSSGWNKKCALWVRVGDEHVRVLCNITMTVVKSKQWKA